jgi:hypothetical protein
MISLHCVVHVQLGRMDGKVTLSKSVRYLLPISAT